MALAAPLTLYPRLSDDNAGREKDQEMLLPITSDGKCLDTNQQSAAEWTKVKVPNYIPSFEGLRGLSVLFVHISHIIPGGLRRIHRAFGATGLDVFFIMSGFLVTGVLMGQQQKMQAKGKSRFAHLPQCYRNRFARLYPALLFVVLSTAVVEYYYKDGKMQKGWRNHMANALLYMANFEPFGPFDKNPTRSIWKHTYSMANQEQWYLLWSLTLPLVLSLCRRKRNSVLLMIIIASLAGRTAHIAHLIKNPLFDTFGFLSWVGRLSLGGYLRLNPIPRFLQSRWSAWAGLLVFGVSLLDAIYGSDNNLKKYGLNTHYYGREMCNLYVALLTSILLVMGSIKGIWLFETKLLRFLGRISYSWFLFQVPLLEIAGWPRRTTGAAITCVAFVAAMFSTFYIEEPIRDWNKENRKPKGTPALKDLEVENKVRS